MAVVAADPSGDFEGEPQVFDESMAPVIVRVQYLKDLSFESPNAPEALTEMNADPEINIGVNVEARKLGDADFEVSLLLNVQAEDGGKKIFIVELEYAGIFTLNSVDEEMVQPLILIEATSAAVSIRAQHRRRRDPRRRISALMIQPVDFLGCINSIWKPRAVRASPSTKPESYKAAGLSDLGFLGLFSWPIGPRATSGRSPNWIGDTFNERVMRRPFPFGGLMRTRSPVDTGR